MTSAFADTAHSNTLLSSGSSFITLILYVGSINVDINATFATAFSTVYSLSSSLLENFSLFKTPYSSSKISCDMKSRISFFSAFSIILASLPSHKRPEMSVLVSRVTAFKDILLFFLPIFTYFFSDILCL